MILAMVVALMIAQSSDLPGAPDTTFEQRWDSMMIKQQLKRDVEKLETHHVEQRPPSTRHAHARRATGCRYGHKVYHGRSWRCRR